MHGAGRNRHAQWRRRLAIVCCGMLLSVGGVHAGEGVRLGDPVELLKLPADQLPPITFARPLIRVSPDARRCLYIRAHGPGKAKLHVRRIAEPRSDQPAVWDEPIPALYCRMSFAGLAWRADGQRVLFCQEPGRDEDGWAQGAFGRRMRPWHMCWDLPNPQYKLCRYMGVKDATGCTAMSYGPRGRMLWTAFSDPEHYKACGVTGWDSAKRRGRTLYRRTGACIYHLAPSRDGKHLAWVETFQRKPRKAFRPPDVVVFDVAVGKVHSRIGLAKHIPGWLDTQPPVWTTDSQAVCYGDVVTENRVFRREVRLLPLGKGSVRALARDALAVGAAAEGIVVNRGPGCVPMAQGLSSFAPPGGGATPRTNDVLLCGPSETEPSVLVPDAFAQQVAGGHVVYARTSGDDVLVLRAKLVREKAGGGLP